MESKCPDETFPHVQDETESMHFLHAHLFLLVNTAEWKKKNK